MKRQIAECKKCGHVWLPREATGQPRICPACKSARWQIGPVPRNTSGPKQETTTQ